MIPVILCDDDAFILKLASEMIRKEIESSCLDAKVSAVVQDAKEMLIYLKSNPDPCLCFLDLDFGDGRLNGLDIARKLKSMNPDHKIVFVTNHQEMAMEVLKSGTEPFGFLEKNTDMQVLRKGFSKYIRMACNVMDSDRKEEPEIVLQLGLGEEISLKLSQITYVETEKLVSHGITYHTMDQSAVTVRDTLEHVSEQLGEGFLRCHRSTLVNKKHITGMESGMLHLSDGTQIPCAFRMKGEVRKCLNSRHL